jgi:hypothetical protein
MVLLSGFGHRRRHVRQPNALSCPPWPLLAGLDLREGDYAHLVAKWLSFRIARDSLIANISKACNTMPVRHEVGDEHPASLNRAHPSPLGP